MNNNIEYIKRELDLSYNLDDLRKNFKRLCLRYHPDLESGCLESMKFLNNYYQEKLKTFDNTKQANDKIYNYSAILEKDIADILYRLITLDKLEIHIIGTWIWCTGETKAYKDVLKELGFRFNPKKDFGNGLFKPCWYWTKENKTRYFRSTSFDKIVNSYGITSIEGRSTKLN